MIYIVLLISLFIQIVSLQTCSNLERGIDRPGQWYVHLLSTTSAGACCALCDSETQCKSWTFFSAPSILAAGCYLKAFVPPINGSSNCGQTCASGVKDSTLVLQGPCAFPGGAYELAVDRPGATYVHLTSIRTHPKCCAMCQMEGNKCQSWTFVRDGAPNRAGGCFLKTQVAPISNTPCVPCTSGKK
ncbi:unnamed protein product [Adineta ricciae]|uniref:Apple domain-containing protein n=1 Tax=Adineta ricciae TaxID=249248 RepID=A0A814JIZ9_ADIRI|nr:unnamed protein product [Adineta ricciae]CAF1390343.1 unnamed protein product [Adineta ricciae]